MKNPNFIPLASPDITQKDIEEVVKVLKSGMLVQGEKVMDLEQKCSAFIHTNHVSALSNGTATMHLALVALGIGKGDEVIIPAFSYIATANVVELVGATPVFVDIELSTFNIDISKIEAAITDKTKAIIPVHEFGLACDMTRIMAIANKNNLFVIEDAACALGAMHNNQAVGTFGDFGSFSLHPRKAITSGEGGLLVSKTLEQDQRIKTLRNHGIKIDEGKMIFVEAGFNYRLTDIQAALVGSQFDRLSEILDKKQYLANQYQQSIKNPKFVLPQISNKNTHTWQTYHLLCETEALRNSTINYLKTKNIGTNYGAQNMPAQTYYANKYKLDTVALFPNADIAYKRGLAIPLYEKLTLEDIEYISNQINTI
ncbi:glutamine--scyllo-inositol aminotransferase [Putridiphycobacter roseus]|uniref:Glutamine--scyllo-inositol aminotransferase n=1 Tax=Putridiphycobacter roseus TaxID=2219161 RepID=A0A2W1NLB6_9FLAO|nr:DegT/DnrJ/EryC1/StrS family aminotransferase [Putridiphycobacter roseus]PZE18636.1 glutamine--scyllo-inositol aminotransferase [Putridiphycobacter roseus]